MKRKSLSQVLGEVDPELTVIPGGSHRRGKRRSRGTNIEDWERSRGPNCPECKQEMMQLVNGVCVQCFREKEAARMEKFERKLQKRYYIEQLRTGRITLTQMRNLR